MALPPPLHKSGTLGVERGDVHITADLITSLFRASTRGATPKNNWVLDGIYDFIAYVSPRRALHN